MEQSTRFLVGFYIGCACVKGRKVWFDPIFGRRLEVKSSLKVDDANSPL